MEYLQYYATYAVSTIIIGVLNLVINGIPSIHGYYANLKIYLSYKVLNLVINGIPSILDKYDIMGSVDKMVLNLVINGIPSILDCNYLWVLCK